MISTLSLHKMFKNVFGVNFPIEHETRDVIFRMSLDSKERRRKPPWSASFTKDEIENENDEFLQQLFDG